MTDSLADKLQATSLKYVADILLSTPMNRGG